MKKSNFSEPQIIKILALQEQGKSVSEICREQGALKLLFFITLNLFKMTLIYLAVFREDYSSFPLMLRTG